MTALSSRRSRTTAVVAVAAAGVLVAAGGVYAVLTASAFNTSPQAVGSGTLRLQLADNGAGFATAVSGLAPGDVVRRHVTLTNSGTLAGKDLALTVTDATPSVLSTDATKGLQVEVAECSVAWTAATGACSGTASTVVASRPLAGLTAQGFAVGTMAAGQARHLQVSLRLPDATEETVNGALPAGTVQGQSAALTWRFTENQRLATDTSS